MGFILAGGEEMILSSMAKLLTLELWERQNKGFYMCFKGFNNRLQLNYTKTLKFQRNGSHQLIGSFQVNVDATFGGSEAGYGYVTDDYKGNVIFSAAGQNSILCDNSLWNQIANSWSWN